MHVFLLKYDILWIVGWNFNGGGKWRSCRFWKLLVELLRVIWTYLRSHIYILGISFFFREQTYFAVYHTVLFVLLGVIRVNLFFIQVFRWRTAIRSLLNLTFFMTIWLLTLFFYLQLLPAIYLLVHKNLISIQALNVILNEIRCDRNMFGVQNVNDGGLFQGARLTSISQ